MLVYSLVHFLGWLHGSILELSWIISLFTVVGADDSIYATFSIQWLFVFCNSFQGFFILLFFVVINRDVQKEWKDLVCSRILTKGSSKKQMTSTTNSSTTKSEKLQVK